MEWFRTDAGFSRHRDFLRLRKELALSRPALAGYMVLLFEAVAEHEEYGDLSTTPDDVIEEWIEWPQDRAGQFADAMKRVGWITSDGEFCGWIVRHKAMLAARDKKRADRKKRGAKKLRSEKRTSRGHAADMPRTSHGQTADVPRLPTIPTVPTEPTKPDVTTFVGLAPTAPDRSDELFAKWNELAAANGLPQAEKLTPKRRAAAKARIAEGLLDRWPEFAAALPKSRHHMGHNDRAWKANPAWLLRPDAWLGVIERDKAAPKPHETTGERQRSILDAIRAIRAEEATNDRA